MSNCIFCEIISGNMPSYTFYEDDEVKVILDRFPGNIGHSLVIPKKHIKNIFDISPEECGKYYTMAVKVARHLKDKLNCDGVNIVQNNGAAAEQSVDHFHIHIIPRYTGDGVTTPNKTKDPSHEEFTKVQDILKTVETL